MRSRLYTDLSHKPRFEWHPRINPRHPMNNGLKYWWLFNEMAGAATGESVYDLVCKAPCTITSGSNYDSSGRWIRNADDVAMGLTYSASPLRSVYATLPNLVFAGNFSILMKVLQNDPVSDTRGMWGVDNYPSSPRNMMILYSTHASFSGAASFEAGIGTGSGQITFSWARATLKYVAIVRSGTTMTFWLNGAAQTPITVDAGAVTFLNHRLASHYYSGAEHNNSWVQIWDLQVLDRAITGTEILEHRFHPYGTYANPRLLVPPFRRAREKGEASEPVADWWPFFLRYLES